MVDVLLHPFRLQWVLYNELDKDVSTDASCGTRHICYHHFFNSLHQIVEVRAEEPSRDDSLETVEYVALHRKGRHIGLDD